MIPPTTDRESEQLWCPHYPNTRPQDCGKCVSAAASSPTPAPAGTGTATIADVANAARAIGRGVTHVLKVWPEYGNALADGSKSFEFRLDDRGFAVGDLLHLREWAPSPDDIDFERERIAEKMERYTGRSWHRRITYIARGGVIPPGYCVLAMVPAPPDDVDPRFIHSPTCTASHFDGTGTEAPDCLACNAAGRAIAESSVATLTRQLVEAQQREHEVERLREAAREYLRCDDVGGNNPSHDRAMDTQRARTYLRAILTEGAKAVASRVPTTPDREG